MTESQSESEKHAFRRPTDPEHTRAPCPGLNALANHGYIPSDAPVPFLIMIPALCEVFNLSLALALLLALPGYVIYGTLSLCWTWSPSIPFGSKSPTINRTTYRLPIPLVGLQISLSVPPFSIPYRHLVPLSISIPIPMLSWTLPLAALSKPNFGLVHPASLVHCDSPGHAPVKEMFDLFEKIASRHGHGRHLGTVPTCGHGSDDLERRGGEGKDIEVVEGDGELKLYVTLGDLARVRATRGRVGGLHRQIALGEVGLLWEVLKVGGAGPDPERIPLERLREFLLDERIPNGVGERPVGLFAARAVANSADAMVLEMTA